MHMGSTMSVFGISRLGISDAAMHTFLLGAALSLMNYEHRGPTMSMFGIPDLAAHSQYYVPSCLELPCRSGPMYAWDLQCPCWAFFGLAVRFQSCISSSWKPLRAFLSCLAFFACVAPASPLAVRFDSVTLLALLSLSLERLPFLAVGFILLLLASSLCWTCPALAVWLVLEFAGIHCLEVSLSLRPGWDALDDREPLLRHRRCSGGALRATVGITSLCSSLSLRQDLVLFLAPVAEPLARPRLVIGACRAFSCGGPSSALLSTLSLC